MERNQGGWKARALVVAWVAALFLLGLTLVCQGWRASGERGEIRRRLERMGREAERARARNQALRDELKALREDPIYVESLLRRWRMAAAEERLLD